MKFKRFVGIGFLFLAVFGARAEVVLFDFETPARYAHLVGPAKKGTYTHFSLTNEFATSGGHSFHFKSAPWKEGMPKWPSVTFSPSVSDWTPYDRVVIDVINIGEGGDSLRLYVSERGKRLQNGFAASTSLPSYGYKRWVVSLALWPHTVDPKNIGTFHLWTSAPHDLNAFIDHITLLKKGEKALAPSSATIAKVKRLGLERHARLRRQFLERRAVTFKKFRKACAAKGVSTAEMLIGKATSMEQVMPRDDADFELLPADKINLRLARQECESAQLVISPANGKALKNVRVQVSDLIKGETRFPLANITCSVVGFVEVKENVPYFASDGDKKNPKSVWPILGWYPYPILDFMKGTDIADGDLQSFWIRVSCPGRQSAGVYKGYLTVRADNAATRKIPFSIRVNDFTLPRTAPMPLAITFSPGHSGLAVSENKELYQRARKDPENPIHLWKTKEDEWVDFLADYYITIDSLYLGGQPRFDALRRLKEQGRLGLFNLGYWNVSHSDKAQKDAMFARIRAAYNTAKKEGILDHAYLYGCDEAPKKEFALIKEMTQELKKEFPGVPLVTTAYDKQYGIGGGLEGIDIFCPVTDYYTPDADRIPSVRKAGKKVWWYIACGEHTPWANIFLEYPAMEMRMLMGAQSVRMRPDGFLYYQISIWNAVKPIVSGPYTQWPARSWTTYNGDGACTCVGPGGMPLSTIKLENFRDGLDDYAYAMMLERMLKSGKGDVAWRTQAKAALAVPRELMKTMTSYSYDPEKLYCWRDVMADLIEKEK